MHDKDDLYWRFKVDHLHSTIHRGFSIQVWFGGISTMYNQKLNLKRLPCISCYMKRSIISFLTENNSQGIIKAASVLINLKSKQRVSPTDLHVQFIV